ncbi:MAG: hypothetical protein M3065_12050 [Actinomycetota bacterium]|nr:hypothetical protein [Actinomycetota bacterium]
MSKLVERSLPRGALLSLGLLATGVTVGIRLTGRRRARARTIARADDAFAREALLSGARLFSELEPAWATHDEGRIRRVIGPELLDRWRSRIEDRAGDSLAVEGPVRFEYIGPGGPGHPGESRALIRVQGGLRATSRAHAISRPQRKVLLGIAAAILTAAFVGIALAPATRFRSAGPTTILVRAGVPVGGVHQLTYKKGAIIEITVRSDRADEIHFHGYDLHRELPAGGAAHLRLRATIEGSFPIELENEGGTLAQVVVEP